MKQQVLDIYCDTDLLRQSRRRLLGRTCWLLSAGPDFARMKPVDAIEAEEPTHQAWLERAQPALSNVTVGSQNCFALLGYKPGTP